MIFLLFLASVVTIETILHYDQARRRRIKSGNPPGYEPAATPNGEGLLALMNGVEQHGRGATPTPASGPVHAIEAETAPSELNPPEPAPRSLV